MIKNFRLIVGSVCLLFVPFCMASYPKTIADFVRQVPLTPTLVVNLWARIPDEVAAGVDEKVHASIMNLLHSAVTDEFGAQCEFQRKVLSLLQSEDAVLRWHVLREDKTLSWCLYYSPFSKSFMDIIEQQKDRWDAQQIQAVLLVFSQVDESRYTEETIDSHRERIEQIRHILKEKYDILPDYDEKARMRFQNIEQELLKKRYLE